MNQIFNLNRFALLFKKHTAENYKSYLMSLFVLIGILSIIIGTVNYKSLQPMDLKQQIAFYVGFLMISGTIFTSIIFANLGEKRKAIAAITLPASSFEKFLVSWLYSYLIFQVVFTAVYYAIILTVIRLGNWPESMVHVINVFSVKDKFYIIFIAYAFLHSIVIYGAIYFKKLHFIKTAFAFFVVLLVIWFLNDQVLQLMIHHKISGNPPFTGLSFEYEVLPQPSPGTTHTSYANIDLRFAVMKWVLVLFGLLSAMMWCAAYYRLKEKKV
ncbi:hypothetical protein BEL04_03650 [Mucilaginibacter sp. PPCGB 2223]|uniref:hypothetical protein n=1 Tax=Mucilaginibacter sp. PPCGB 2223 TaxID=1886027 RepID=UPI0008262B51|nr:hypothetical protein [Mucilaginibacter sp. PPCGB 2223]OCX53407.1 hypothetical protein BEL04_03650 [Mucilaginibacter sp. PPCGB 2223]